MCARRRPTSPARSGTSTAARRPIPGWWPGPWNSGKQFDRRSGTTYYRETGTLTLQTRPDFDPLRDGYQGLCDLGYQPRWLDADDVRREFPQFANVDSGYIMEGVGGYIAAGPATRALAEAAAEQGADVFTGAEVVELSESGRPRHVRG